MALELGDTSWRSSLRNLNPMWHTLIWETKNYIVNRRTKPKGHQKIIKMGKVVVSDGLSLFVLVLSRKHLQRQEKNNLSRGTVPVNPAGRPSRIAFLAAEHKQMGRK